VFPQVDCLGETLAAKGAPKGSLLGVNSLVVSPVDLAGKLFSTALIATVEHLLHPFLPSRSSPFCILESCVRGV
jgi:hypothetical protein